MAKEFITAGYLDVKISAKAKRGFTPWKAWKKLWCELKKIDNIDNGLEIKLKSSAESNSVNCFVIPRNATICRTESRTKQFSFGIFGPDRCHKPLLFLSGVSESDSQLWMVSIRRMLSIASHLPVPDGSYYVSLVDNDYSRVAGLTGLHGNLSTNSREVTIKDPFTGDTRTTLPWYQLHQFHLAATGSTDDEKKIVVMHTSKEFRSGPGQLHLFCLKAPQVLESLMTRGKIPRIYVNSFMDTRRFSRSDGDLRESENSISNPADSPSSPVYYRSHSGSDDSGVRVSMASDDSTLVLKCKKAASLISLGFGLLMATPGGSEIDTESSCDLLENEEQCISSQFINIAKRGIDDPRRESGISVMSGVYEEIPDLPSTPSKDDKIIVRQSVHTYEDPIDIILTSVTKFSPPPLPPRRELFRHNSFSTTSTTSTSFSTGCVSPPCTPADALSERSNLIDALVPICESEYMVMTPAKPQAESIYLSMGQGQATDLENTYMVMSGKGTTND